MLIQGSNMAECHPVGFRWVMKAKQRGATIIHVDPRFTRTSAVADLHLPIRAGTDIAFLGGLVRYVIEHEKYFREYVVPYTNAATILSQEFRDTEELDGLFSGSLAPPAPTTSTPRCVAPAPAHFGAARPGSASRALPPPCGPVAGAAGLPAHSAPPPPCSAASRSSTRATRAPPTRARRSGRSAGACDLAPPHHCAHRRPGHFARRAASAARRITQPSR